MFNAINWKEKAYMWNRNPFASDYKSNLKLLKSANSEDRIVKIDLSVMLNPCFINYVHESKLIDNKMWEKHLKISYNQTPQISKVIILQASFVRYLISGMMHN